MSKCVTFGELMMRLNPEGYYRIVQASKYEISFAGGEASVGVSLANYGHDAVFVSKLPDNEIGQAAVNDLRKYGVDTSAIKREGPRMGVYYVEKGASQRPSKVIYDRAGSSIALAKPSDFDWDEIFAGADWFHFTGITPPLGPNLPQICEDACIAAKAHGVNISCDLNFRKKLWSGEQAHAVMSKLMPYIDVCIANEEDAQDVFGIRAADTDLNTGKISHDGYLSVARQLAARFHFKKVAITLRGSISASVNNWAAILYDAASDTAVLSPEYQIMIVDRVGGGDSFAGGLIHALLTGMKDQEAINFAVAASCLKHTIEHDFNQVTITEVENLANGNTSGRVQR